MTTRKHPIYSSKIIKVGALLADTKTLLAQWDETQSSSENLKRARDENIFSKASRFRVDDILLIFRQRYLLDESATSALVSLMHAGYSNEVLDRIHYYVPGWEIEEMAIEVDHVQVFVQVPPKYAPAQIVQIMKSISSRKVFKQYPELRKQLWGGEFWSDGFFVRSVGDKVTAEFIKKYIRYQKTEASARKLRLWD